MLARAPSRLVRAALAAVLLFSGCSKDGGSGASPCGTPTAKQCLDPAWLASDPCGVAQREAMRIDPRAFCNQIVLDASEAATEDLVPETVIDPETGATVDARRVPNAEDG